MTKDRISFHCEPNGRRFPAVNVRVYIICSSSLNYESIYKISDKESQAINDYVWEANCSMFWDCCAQEIANEILPSGCKIYSEGRSSGWLVVHGLPDYEDWDEAMFSTWDKFEKAIHARIKDLFSLESIKELVNVNYVNHLRYMIEEKRGLILNLQLIYNKIQHVQIVIKETHKKELHND